MTAPLIAAVPMHGAWVSTCSEHGVIGGWTTQVAAQWDAIGHGTAHHRHDAATIPTMARTSTTTWVCDRCGGEQTTETNDQPTGWHGVVVTSPPEAGPTGLPRRHLCADCTRALEEFMDPDHTD